MGGGDTIVAVATPPGRGGIGILRLSGPAVPLIAGRLLGRIPEPRRAVHTLFRDNEGDPVDDGVALYFPAPNSFTGEAVLELQGHGSPVVLDRLAAAAIACGARPARPGEFSERAFLNGKLDLAQAEAVADLIDAASAQAARAALRSLQGEFSRRIHALVEALTELRMFVEAAIDFPAEEIDFIAESDVGERLAALTERLAGISDAATQGSRLREGITLVIAGRPNAGKSSLLNALSGRESAIVTEIPGTTRDLLREQILLDGVPVHIIDTAGLRDTDDPVEREGVRRARAAVAEADRLLVVVDDAQGEGGEVRALLNEFAELPVTLVHNKIDLTGRKPNVEASSAETRIYLSAREGSGIDLLRRHLREAVGLHTAGEGEFTARRRHLDALARASAHLHTAADRLTERAPELLAEELRLAQQALGEITGEFTSDDLLGRIFSSFCIGK